MEIEDTLSLYEAMACYDFQKPIKLSISFEDNYFIDHTIGSNSFIQKEIIAQSSQAYEKRIDNVNECNRLNEITSFESSGKTKIMDDVNSMKQNYQVIVRNNSNNGNKQIPNENSNDTDTSTCVNFDGDSVPQWVYPLQCSNENTPTMCSLFNNMLSTNHINKQVHSDQNLATVLYTLSKHLISVLKEYAHYTRLHYYGAHNNDVEKAKNSYIRIKRHTFSLCYDMTLQILVPLKNNVQFINEFIHRTTTVAMNEENFKCFANDVKCVYDELIVWATQRRNLINMDRYVGSSKNMSMPFPRNSTVSDEVSQHLEINEHGTCQENQNNTILFSYGPLSKEVSISINTDILSSINGPNHENSNMTNKDNYSKSNGCHNDSLANPEPNSQTEVTMSQERHLEHQYSNTQLDTTRISISRDSGVMSPAINDTNREEPFQDNVIPYITHITSLNPNVAYTPQGDCCICGVKTKFMCLGCKKYYFCSNECQKTGWNAHKYICTAQETT